jgi:mono/diheme cytochrome c family protein
MMMRKWTIIGFIATVIIAVALPVYALNEAGRMVNAQASLLTASIEHGQVVYAENCVVCHGPDGQGISAYPGLANEGVQSMDYDTLFKVIERGRYDTAMAAWGVNEGGVLNDMQIDQLIAMIRQGDWAETALTVDRLGLSPPTVISIEISDDILADLANLPHGEVIVDALPVYAANCIGCHGAQGEGTAIAPALNDDSLRSQNTDADLNRIITNGVPGTLMAGWDQALTPSEITGLVGLIRYWPEIPTGLIPQPELPPIASTNADVIAAGEKLYNVACSSCHGHNGQGTRMAPALNVQSFLTQTNDQAMKAIISQGVPDTRMPAWGGRLTDEQLNSLISFIRAWEPDAPVVAQPTQGGERGQGGGPPWLRDNQEESQGGLLQWLWGN